MLHIRSEQLNSLDRDSGKRLKLRLLARLQKLAPEACSTKAESEILSVLDESIRVAAQLGARSDKALSQFACLAFLLGRGFWNIPAVKDFLLREEMPTDQKIYLLTERVRKREEKFHRER